MKTITSFLAALVLTPLAALQGAEFYVSPNGNDGNSGGKEQPFATIQQAQKAARQARSQGQPVTIYLRGGTHYLTEPLVFSETDSGTKESPVIYRAFDQEAPVISGGVKLDLKWTPYRDGILQAKVPHGFKTDQLFVNGVRQHLARYPNFDPDQRIYNGYSADAISPARVKRWADPRGGFIHAMHSSEWGGYHFVITGKKEDGTVAYEGGWQNNRPSEMHGRYRFVENIFEELDARVNGFSIARPTLSTTTRPKQSSWRRQPLKRSVSGTSSSFGVMSGHPSASSRFRG